MNVNATGSNILLSQMQLESNNSELHHKIIRISAEHKIGEASANAINALLSTSANTDARFLERAYANAADSASMLNIASGTLDQASELAMQAEELSIRANSAAISDEERALLDERYASIISQIDDLASSTTFNGQQIFGNSFSLFLGTEASEVVEVQIDELSTSGLGLSGTSLSTVENAAAAQSAIQSSLDTIIGQHGAIGNAASLISTRAENLSKELFSSNTSKIRINSPGSLHSSVDLARSLINQSPTTAMQMFDQSNLSAFLTSLS